MVLVAIAVIAVSLVTNPNYEWGTVGRYLFADAILSGVFVTVWLTLVGMVIACALGIVFALMRMSDAPVLQWVSHAYIWFFRGTPLLVQLIFWYNLASLYPKITLGIPFVTTFTSYETNAVVSPYMAAILGLGLAEGAYMAEVIRAGIMSVDAGQREAGMAIGMRRGKVMRRIVLPQAMRFIVPPTANQLISLCKGTALISVLSLPELLYSAQIIYNRTYETIPLLIVASLWYLAIVSVLSVVQHYLEIHYGRGHTKTARTGRSRQFAIGRRLPS